MESSTIFQDKKQEARYKLKLNSSFETKLQLYLFSKAICEKEIKTIDRAEFAKFIIKEDIVGQYTAEYWQQERHTDILEMPIDKIYSRIKILKTALKDEINKWKEDYINSFEDIFPKQQFKELIEQNHCHYCGITIAEIEELSTKKQLFKKNERGWTLEIDRKNSNYEYTAANCVMACYWCNNAKTDEFTEEEFLLIGKSIRVVWKKRLGRELAYTTTKD